MGLRGLVVQQLDKL